MSEHTPGPWEACPVDGDGSRQIEAQIEMVGEVYDGIHQDANARLIAAAPEMLEALKDCADSLEAEVRDRWCVPDLHPANEWRFERDMEPVNTARALIAKVAGAEEEQ